MWAWGRSSAGEHLLCTQGVRGSNPLVSTTPHLERGFAISPPLESGRKSRGSPLHEAADAFLLSKRVAGCTEATLGGYAWWLRRLIAEIPLVTPLAVRQFFAGLQDRSPSLQRNVRVDHPQNTEQQDLIVVNSCTISHIFERTVHTNSDAMG